MVKNLLDNFSLKMHKTHEYVEFPSVLSQMEADDAQLELASISNVQKCRLHSRKSIYKQSFENVVGRSIGIIIANSKA